MIYKILLNLDS